MAAAQYPPNEFVIRYSGYNEDQDIIINPDMLVKK